jgi:hypothetical protein
MIDDFQPLRNKPKRIEPLDTPPQRSIHELAAEHDKMNQPSDNIAEPAFQPPEEIAAEEGAVAGVSTADEPSNTSVHHDTKHPKFLSWRWRLNKKWTLIAAATTAALIFGAGLLAYSSQIRDEGGSFASKRSAYTPKVTTVASNLTGLQVDPSINQRPVTGIMIENSTDARPQSGLDQAGVVFEAIAEGGITRFLALFQDNQPDYIGPVRSARPYYVQWCMGFDCALAHVGGSPEALSNIKAWGTKDLDQFSNSGGYARISSRYAPHNVYTSIAKLNQLEAGKKFGTATYTSLPRKKDAASPTPNATSINLAISGAQYNAHFDYDATSNSYKRSEGGAAHMVVNSAGQQTQISPKVVVALVMQYGLEADDHHSQYNVTGSGQAFVFQDGTVTPATWSKTDKSAPMTLTGSDNHPVQLNAGQTWFTALSSAGLVSYH